MRGVVPLGNQRVEVREIPDPVAGPGEVIVEVKSAGVCGSDLHAFRKSWEEIGERQGLVIGHEAGGIVKEVGQGVSSSLIGRRVSVYHYRGCGVCRHCLSGNLMLCKDKRGYGWHVHGADAALLLTDARNCCELPQQLSFDDGAILACAAGTAYSALRKLERIEAEGYLAVFGLGPVGLSAAILAKAKGLRAIGIDLSIEKGKFARAMDIAVLENPGTNLSEALRQTMGGELPRMVFDATGSERGLESALETVGIGGGVVTVGKGMWPLRFTDKIDVADLIRKQICFMGSWVLPLSYYYDMVDLMLSAGVTFSAMVTARFPVEEAQAAFEKANDPGGVGKVMLTWDR